MANISVTVQDGNNITLVTTPTPTQVITIDRGIAGPAGPAGVPGGSTTQVQYNLASNFAGSPNFTFNGTLLNLIGSLSVSGTTNFGATINTGTGVTTGNAAIELGANRTGDGNALLDFHATSGTDYEFRIIRATGLNGITTMTSVGTGNILIQQQGAGNLIFSTNSSERMRLDSSGNLSIGTTNSSSLNKLEVLASADAQRIAIRANNTNNSSGIEAQSNDYFSTPSYIGTAIQQYGSTASGTTAGISNVNLGILRFLNSGTSLIYTNNSSPIVFATTSVERMRLDASGNLGLGVTPSAWSAGAKVIQLSGGGSISGQTSNTSLIHVSANAVEAAGYKYIASTFASDYYQYAGGHYWLNAPSGTAGAAITFTQAMTLDASGNLLVGVTSNNFHSIKKPGAETTTILQILNATGATAAYYAASGFGWSGTNTAMLVANNSASGRSINASGTINASGADYAEYENNNGLAIIKGSVVGFRADGTLTLTFAEAIRFGVKSTNPSYVGGDTWGTEETLGIKKIEDNAVEFEATLEAARKNVDRIAYSGKVPCNVTGATPGDYIVAAANLDGQIHGWVVTDPDFAQYKKAVGRVNRILPDGRCELAVIIH